jgi:hypothetical protein
LKQYNAKPTKPALNFIKKEFFVVCCAQFFFKITGILKIQKFTVSLKSMEKTFTGGVGMFECGHGEISLSS